MNGKAMIVNQAMIAFCERGCLSPQSFARAASTRLRRAGKF